MAHDDPGHDEPSPDVPVDAADASPSEPVNEPERAPADLDTIGRDLAGVEAALSRLEAGCYWTDEFTGAPIPLVGLAADPVARRAGTQ